MCNYKISFLMGQLIRHLIPGMMRAQPLVDPLPDDGGGGKLDLTGEPILCEQTPTATSRTANANRCVVISTLKRLCPNAAGKFTMFTSLSLDKCPHWLLMALQGKKKNCTDFKIWRHVVCRTASWSNMFAESHLLTCLRLT